MPITIMEKKFPIIHSKRREKRRRTGPVKKKIPLGWGVSFFTSCFKPVRRGEKTYATASSEPAPPQPINMAEKVRAEITNLRKSVSERKW
jgi:hypothetical protein